MSISMMLNADLWRYDTIGSHVWQINLPVVDPTNKIYYAVDVELDCSPCDSVPAIGLYNSHIRIITGRPGFTGVPGQAYYEGGADNLNAWHEGILIDKKVGISSQAIELAVNGGVGSVSGFRFSINDCEKQWQYINVDAYQFVNRKITHYVVIENIFYPVWSGVIEDAAYDDLSVEFSCVNSFNAVHKPMPPRSAVQPEFPNTD